MWKRRDDAPSPHAIGRVCVCVSSLPCPLAFKVTEARQFSQSKDGGEVKTGYSVEKEERKAKVKVEEEERQEEKLKAAGRRSGGVKRGRKGWR